MEAVMLSDNLLREGLRDFCFGQMRLPLNPIVSVP
jgi:hypothetical protein